MKRAPLTIALLLAATSAWAEWVMVAETRDAVFFVDPASVGSKGNLRQATVVQDYAVPEAGGIRSRQVTYEIDCAGERLRSLAVAEHSAAMARGAPVSSSARESEWLVVAPRTGSNIASKASYRAILRFVCSR
ncbi:MAG: hypothetical protein IPJ62_03905 [Betaproteobacteria bacterium]|nr:hypothetical protein [Betaproteobacteria bacterium]